MAAPGIEFGTKQIRQLIEIDDARRKRGEPSIGPEVQAIIARLTSGGVGMNAAVVRTPGGAKVIDPRRAQAKVLWDKRWPSELKNAGGKPLYPKFSDYFASIPEIPTSPEGYDTRFPRLILVDQRITLTKACALLGVEFKGDDDTFVPRDPAQAVAAPVYWMRCQDGHIYRDWKPSTCRRQFEAYGDEVGLSAFEGISLYAQHPDVIEEHFIDLMSSVCADSRDHQAFLQRWADGGVELGWYWDDGSLSSYGSASRGIAGLNPRA